MTISVAGTAFQSDRSTALTSKSIGLRVNGGSETLVTSHASTGEWSFPTVTVSVGDTISLYINGETERGNTVTITDGVTDISGVEISDKHLVLDSHNGTTALTIADMASWDHNDDVVDMLFDANTPDANVLETDFDHTIILNSALVAKMRNMFVFKAVQVGY